MKVSDNFFFIDSDNINETESRLYGYAIIDKDLNSFLSDDDLCRKTIDGTFVAVQNLSETVAISQDSIGAYGTYLFIEDGYFAISNSFLFLVEKLRDSHLLTIDKDYIDHLILSTYTTFAITETPISEIKCLQRNQSIRIDKKSKSIEVIDKPIEIETIEIDSLVGLSLLDDWYKKWTAIFKRLSNEGRAIRADLTGGMDSRIAFALLLESGADLDKVSFNAYTDKLHTHVEDFEIASKIGEDYGFCLNEEPSVSSHEIGFKDDIEKSFYVKLGLHREMRFTSTIYDEPLFHITGSGGELIREYQYSSLKEMVEEAKRRQGFLDCDYDFIPGFRKVLERSREDMEKLHGRIFSEKEFGRMLFREANNPTHFGKAMTELYLANEITLAPLEDQKLQLLNPLSESKDLLAALIYMRYCPELLDYPFDSDRRIPQHSLDHARRICEKHPFKPEQIKNGTSFEIVIDDKRELIDSRYEHGSRDEWCRQMMVAPFTKYLFCALYPERVYEKLRLKTEEDRWMSISSGYVIISIAAYAFSTIYSSKESHDGIYNYFMGIKDIPSPRDYGQLRFLSKMYSSLDKLSAAIIEFKISSNNGNKPDLEIISSTLDDSRFTPLRRLDKGEIGKVAHCYNVAEAKFTFMCTQDGLLEIKARGPWTQTTQTGEHVPVFLDYTSFKINGRKIIKTRTPVTYDEPFVSTMSVKAGKKVTIDASWSIHDWNSEQLKGVFKQLMEKSVAKTS